MLLIRACSRYLSTAPVRRKLSLLTALIAVGVILLSVIAARMQYLDLHATRMSALHNQVEMAQTILARYASLADTGELTLAQAQAQAIETLAAARSPSNSGYFTLLGTDQTIVMHPFRRERAGRPLQDFDDGNGVNQYVEQLAVARTGGGYFAYTSRRSSDSEPLVRQTYAELYEPWGWVITTGTYTEDVQKQALGFTAVMALSGGLLVLLVLALSWLIGNRIVRPLQRATLVAAAIADGRLDNDTGCDGDDEPARLLHSMGRMQQRLQAVIGATRQMAHLHGAGQTSHRIDSHALPGDYGLMTEEINALVADHVDTATMVADLVQRYALGDLSQQAPRLPGEKARLSRAMDTVKANLGAISDEISRLSQAAVEGDFSVRGDQERYQHGFAAMVGRLNLLMQTCDSNLQGISRMLQAIASGDLTQRMHGEQQGVFAQMRDDANTTMDNLVRIVSRIQLATGSINAAAGEIASGNQDLSQRTEQQAASLEETAASMEELTSTVRQNADHARQANQLALGAAQVASSGGEVVGQVIQTMDAIEQSSQRIADILSVIDGIAFQTNILALNAAVEAARAGDQGRGFAVVASEVRTLAQSSAAAAKQIKVLIDNSVERVSAGATLVHKAGHTMQEIVTSVDRVTGIMGQISAASQEQTAGIEQVSQTVMQMDQATQQNAALVQEASAAAQSMEDQARQLADAVAVFRIAHQGTASATTTGS